jgi:hypothetical protein
VDTVALAGSAVARTRAGSTRFRASDIRDVPHRFDDLASIAALSSQYDEALGWQGLPGDLTLVVADGVPVYRAPHPSGRAEMLPSPLFPRASLAGVSTFDGRPDLEWAGTPGGYLGVTTVPATGIRGYSLEGAYSGDPTWSSSDLTGPTPPLTSFQGDVRGGFALSPEGARIALTASALRHQTPLGPRVSETVAAALTGVDPDLLASLSAPGVESYSRYSGQARVDASRSPSTRFFLRGAGGYAKREFDGVGPVSLARGAALGEESIDFSVAGGIVSQYSQVLTFELLAGVSGSDRDFPGVPGTPSAYLADSGSWLGEPASAAGESARTDVVFLPAARYAFGNGTVEFGVPVRASGHRMSHSPALAGDLRYASAAALLAGRGAGEWSSTPETPFTTREVGLFAQYRGAPAPGFEVTLGGRYDSESFSVDEVEVNEAWFDATGLRNDEAPSSFHQFGARGSLEWTPSPDGSTRLFLSGSVTTGDLDTRAIYQLVAEDTDASSTDFAGTGLDWQAASVPPAAPAALPTLTLFGPDTRAPRSAILAFGITRSLTDDVSGFVRGSFRRTDFLMRRRNVNLPVVAPTVDMYGRSVFATLQKDGALVTAAGTGARRFDAFGDVWATDSPSPVRSCCACHEPPG